MSKFRYILFWSLLICLIVLPCHASENQPPVQKMSHLLAKLKKNPNDVQSLIDASFTYIDLCDYDGAKQMASRLEMVSRTNPDSLRALFYSRLLSGWAMFMDGHGRKGINTISEALEFSSKHEMVAEQAIASNLMGVGYVSLDLDYTQGLAYYNEALAGAKSIGDHKLAISILNNLAETYLWGMVPSGVKYAYEAINLSREHNYMRGVLTSLINAIHFRLYSNDLDGVSRMIDEVEGLQNKFDYLSQVEIILVKGRLAMAQGDNEKAASIFAHALEDTAPIMPKLLRIKTLLYYSWADINLNKIDEAIKICEEALSLCNSTGYNYFSGPLQYAIAYCKEKTGDYRGAYASLKRYAHYTDSIQLKRQIDALSRVRVENEVRLNESKISRQQAQLKARQRYIIFLVSTGIILVAGLLAMIHLYRRKQRLVRTVIEREKESVVRERLLKQSLDQVKAELAASPQKPDSQSQSSTALTEERMDELMVRFNELMTEKKAYTNPNISIKSVAEALNTNRTYLSNAINHVFNKSFPSVLAEYRVRAAIEMINNPECDLPLKAIAAEAGFSSSSVFFTTFRNIVGITPAAYRKGLNPNQ